MLKAKIYNLDEYVFGQDAIKENEYICPSCEEKVILKKGRIKIHHFAHKSDSECLFICNNFSFYSFITRY